MFLNMKLLVRKTIFLKRASKFTTISSPMSTKKFDNSAPPKLAKGPGSGPYVFDWEVNKSE